MPALSVGNTGYGSIGVVGEHDAWTVSLVAGQTYEFRLHSIGANQLVDPEFRLLNPSAVQVASNDDAGSTIWGGANNLDSRIVYTAATTGTYTLDVFEHGNNATGNYIVTAAQYNASGMVFTNDEIAWQLINNGADFFSEPNGQAFNVGADNALTFNVQGLTAAGQYLARQALLAWTNVTGITFTETAGAAEITFDDNAAGAFANTATSGSTITSSTVNISTAWLSSFGTTLNSYSFETYIHEIGHALGLFHGGNYNGSAIYGTDNFYLNDSLAHSIMSYMQAANDEFSGPNTFVNASFRYMFTPAMADIIAIQYLYGLRGPLIHSGNTTYGYGSNTGNTALDNAVNSGASMFFTVFDEAGNDTLNFSLYGGNQVIDLHAESFSNVLGGRMNVSIARNVTIENAYGGGGNDAIYGNDVANTLVGGGGSDTIAGLGGVDYLYGNSGIDFLLAGTGNDYIFGGDDRDHIFGENGFDVIFGEGGDDIIYAPSDGVGDYVDAGAGHDFVYGGAGADNIIGGTGFDNLSGGGGNDTISGDADSDFIYGQAGSDTIYGGSGTDYLYGGTEADVLVGEGDGDFLMEIGAGNAPDQAYGGDGNDFFFVGDRFSGGQSYMDGGAGDDIFLYGNAGDIFLGGSGQNYMWTGGGVDIIRNDKTGTAGFDVVYDWQDGFDLIQLTGGDTYGGLLAQGRIGYDASTNSTVILDPGYVGGIILLNTHVSLIGAADFI